MNRIGRWAFGLIPLFIVWIGAIAVMTAPIESGIEANVSARVPALGTGPAKISVLGRDVRLDGEAVESIEAENGILAAKGSDGVRLVDSALNLAPLASPFSFAAARDGARVTLSGNVPSADAQAKLAAAAKTAGFEVDDKLVVARGAPAGFAVAAATGIAALANLSSGRADLVGEQIKLSGVAKPGSSAQAILASLSAALPTGITQGAHALTDDGAQQKLLAQAAADAAKKKADAQAALDAAQKKADEQAAADAAKKKADEQAARETATKAADAQAAADAKRKADEQAAADAAKKAAEAQAAADAAKKAADAQAAADAAKKVGEQAAANAGKTAVAAQLGESSNAGAKTLSAAENSCQTKIGSILKANTINFRTGSSHVNRASRSVLALVLAALQGCDTVAFEVNGHTDNVGAPEDNLELSKDRAQAVVDYLDKAGIAPDRLTAHGFGQDRPIDDNATPDGRSRNRRIEILVK